MKKSPKKYKVENTYRSDIKFNTTNYKKANVIRALQYENIDYEIRDNNIIYVDGEKFEPEKLVTASDIEKLQKII